MGVLISRTIRALCCLVIGFLRAVVWFLKSAWAGTTVHGDVAYGLMAGVVFFMLHCFEACLMALAIVFGPKSEKLVHGLLDYPMHLVPQLISKPNAPKRLQLDRSRKHEGRKGSKIKVGSAPPSSGSSSFSTSGEGSPCRSSRSTDDARTAPQSAPISIASEPGAQKVPVKLSSQPAAGATATKSEASISGTDPEQPERLLREAGVPLDAMVRKKKPLPEQDAAVAAAGAPNETEVPVEVSETEFLEEVCRAAGVELHSVKPLLVLPPDVNRQVMAHVAREFSNPAAHKGKGGFATVLITTLPEALAPLLAASGLDHLVGKAVAVKAQVRGSISGGSVIAEGRVMYQLQGCQLLPRVYCLGSGEVVMEDGSTKVLDCLFQEYAEEGSLPSWGDSKIILPEVPGVPIKFIKQAYGGRYSMIRCSPDNWQQQALALLAQVIGILGWASFLKVSHGDIKPDNFLVFTGGNVKLGDWGSSSPMGQVPPASSEWFLPPEGRAVVQGERDMWAAAVTVLKMLLPKADRFLNIGLTVTMDGEEKFWREVLGKKADGSGGLLEDEKELLDLLQRMLAIQAQDRITAAAAMRHPYFVRHCGGDLEGFWRKVLSGMGPCLS